MKARTFLSVSALCAALAAAPAFAQSTERGSHGSAGMSEASATLGNGSLQVFAGSGHLVVAGVETVGDVVVVVLEGVGQASALTLRLSAEVAGGASLAVGTSVQVVAEASGYLLSAAGRVIAFVPNEVGRSLLHHTTYVQAR